MSFVPTQILDLTAFNEVVNVEATPIVQASPEYGIRDNVQVLNVGTGANAIAQDSNFVLTSGTSANGLASVLTIKQSRYRSGQALSTRITAIFGTPQALAQQACGLINSEDYVVFGYNGLTFGVFRGYNGKSEYRTLTITAAATANGNITLTVNGTAFVVPITIGTTQHVAYQIATSMATQDMTHNYTSNGSTVNIISSLPGAQAGTWSYAPAATGTTATLTQVVAGVLPTIDFVAQSNWDNPPSWAFDPAKGNVYVIELQWLGYGNFSFGIENPDTGRIEIVHVMKLANTLTVPSVANPVFRVGWVIQNLGNTTSITLKGCSLGAFVNGKIVYSERPRALDTIVLALPTTETTLLTIRNRTIINNRYNRENILPRALTFATDSSKGAIVTLAFNDVTTGDLIFAYIDSVNSIMEYSLNNIPVSSFGRRIASFVAKTGQTLLINLESVFTEFYPRETVYISARTISGAAADVQMSFIWLEDF